MAAAWNRQADRRTTLSLSLRQPYIPTNATTIALSGAGQLSCAPACWSRRGPPPHRPLRPPPPLSGGPASARSGSTRPRRRPRAGTGARPACTGITVQQPQVASLASGLPARYDIRRARRERRVCTRLLAPPFPSLSDVTHTAGRSSPNHRSCSEHCAPAHTCSSCIPRSSALCSWSSARPSNGCRSSRSAPPPPPPPLPPLCLGPGPRLRYLPSTRDRFQDSSSGVWFIGTPLAGGAQHLKVQYARPQVEQYDYAVGGPSARGINPKP